MRSESDQVAGRTPPFPVESARVNKRVKRRKQRGGNLGDHVEIAHIHIFHLLQVDEDCLATGELGLNGRELDTHLEPERKEKTRSGFVAQNTGRLTTVTHQTFFGT
jgi:hypothetical protein